MARIVGNRIVPDEIIEQDTWRTNMNPQNQWGNYGINTLGNAPFSGLEQFPLAHAGVAGPEYLEEDVLNMNQNLDDLGIYTHQKGEPFIAENRGNILKNLFNPEVNWRGYQRRPGDFNFPSVMGGIMNAVKDQFEYRPATEEAWDPNTGEFISAEEQDKQNALGGYYSAAAKHARKQRARVVNMLAREKAGQEYGEDNLRDLLQKGYGEKITEKVTDVVQPGKGTTYTGPKTSYFDPGIAARTQHPTERARTQGGYTDPGKDSYGPWKAEGGRIGYRNGEFVDEDVNIQGPGFDVNENIEMASGEGEGDILEQLVAKYIEAGFPPEQAQQMAMQELQQMVAQSGQGEGIASLV